MSEATDELKAKLAKDKELDAIKANVAARKAIIDDKRTTLEIERIQQAEEELAKAKNLHFGSISEEEIKSIQKNNIEYIESAKKGMTFINNEFKGVVPFFRKNLVLIGGKTGEGKSTVCANVVWSTLTQKNPETGKGRRALVITNEERSEDVINRVVCLAKGWHYTNHDKFTEEQIRTFDEWIPKLTRGGRLTVIDNTYGGANGLTTSLEGIQTIFDNLIRDKEYYDVIIMDYYQNVKYSKKNPYLDEWKVQAILANMLDKYKNEYPAPIVVLAQVNPPDKEKKTPFEYRIKGRKIICDPSTLIMEMVADRENLRTEWIIHKSRFTEAVGKSFFTGYDRGLFVPYSVDFIKKVNKIKEEKMMREIQRRSEGGKSENKPIDNTTSNKIESVNGDQNGPKE